MNRTVLIPLAVIVLAAACEDRPAPTAPPPSPSMSVTPAVKGASSICRTYSRALNRVNALLARGAAARELQKTADAYNRLLAGTCN